MADNALNNSVNAKNDFPLPALPALSAFAALLRAFLPLPQGTEDVIFFQTGVPVAFLDKGPWKERGLGCRQIEYAVSRPV